MKNFIVNVKMHYGWKTINVESETFQEAAIKAVIEEHQFLKLDKIPYTVEFKDGEHQSVCFYENSVRFKGFGKYSSPGDYWFSQVVREGKPDDCQLCGGSGVDFYNPFENCKKCNFDKKDDLYV